MSREDREVIDLCAKNQNARRLSEMGRRAEERYEQHKRAERRAERRRVHYRTVMPILFFLGGMSAVVGVWLYWMYEHSLACLLAFGMAGILVGYGFHFDDKSRA